MTLMRVMAILGFFVISLYMTKAQAQSTDEQYKRWHSPTTDFKLLKPWEFEAEAGSSLAWDRFFGNAKLVRETDTYLDTKISLGLRASAFVRHDSDTLKSPTGNREIDREEYTLEILMEGKSMVTELNKLLYYKLTLGAGLSYMDWNGAHPHFVMSIGAEVANKIPGYDVGPFAGFNARLGRGLDAGHLSGRVMAGLRYASSYPNNPVPEVRVYGFYGGNRDESEHDWEIVRNSVRIGGGILVRLFNWSLRTEGGTNLRSWGYTEDPNGFRTRKSDSNDMFAQISLGVQF